MKKYTANQAIVINDTRYDKGATIEMTEKAAANLVAANKIQLQHKTTATKSAAKNTKASTEDKA